MTNRVLLAKLEQLLAKTPLVILEQQKHQLVKLIELLDKWNKTYNLTAITDPLEMMVKHILDSIIISPHLKGKHFIDVGTGPGLPGLPLAIINPNYHFYLLDSLGKRINFIRNAVSQLKLDNVIPLLDRVENFKSDILFDGVITRAFSSLKKMTELTGDLLDKNGYFYALKGICKQEEIDEISDPFEVNSVIKLFVPGLVGERHLILISKVNNE